MSIPDNRLIVLRDRQSGIAYQCRTRIETGGRVRIIDALFPLPRYLRDDGTTVSVAEMGGDVVARIIDRRKHLDQLLTLRAKGRKEKQGQHSAGPDNHSP